MHRETSQLFTHLVCSGGSVADLLTAPDTVLIPQLAAFHYRGDRACASFYATCVAVVAGALANSRATEGDIVPFSVTRGQCAKAGAASVLHCALAKRAVKLTPA
jgi:hypothetical protein